MEHAKIVYELHPLQDIPVYGEFYLPIVLVRCVRTSAVLSSRMIHCAIGENLNVKFDMVESTLVYVKQTEFYKQAKLPF